MIPESGSNPPPSPCPVCGHAIPADAPGGLCPRCVLLGASRPSEPAPPAGGVPEPGLDEVRAAFPALDVVERLGAGGMGVVFKARQPALDRWVALKVLPGHLAADPAFAERFQREARTLARLSHPGIVAVHEFGQAGPFCYLILEYVDGVTLRQAMRAGRMSPAEALALVPRICEALQYAHDHGVLHRDIKPENILLDTAGRVKIADFGIAKLVGDPRGDITLTEDGARLGTPHYMAPEQVEDPARVDHRADIYSLGVVFYELLTGELPLGRFAAPSAKSALDARIDEIVLRALAKERELRQQSAGEVKTQVEDVARHPAPATPAPPKESVPAANRVNGAAALVGVSLLLTVPPLLILGYVATGRVGGIGIAVGEWMVIAATLLPGLACGLAGTAVAASAVPAARERAAFHPGWRRLAFALGTWPALAVHTLGAVAALIAVFLIRGSGISPGPGRILALGAMVLMAAGPALILPQVLWHHLRGTRWREDGAPRTPSFLWILHAGVAGIFLITLSGFLVTMLFHRATQSARAAHPDNGLLLTEPQSVRIGSSPLPSAQLRLPAGRRVRVTARAWSNGVPVPGNVLEFDILGDRDRPLVADLRWNTLTEGPARDPDPAWTVSVTDARGTFQHRPRWIDGQPTRWVAHGLVGSLVVVPDPQPAPPSTPILTGMGPGSAGSTPWQITLEMTWRPAAAESGTAESAELRLALEQLGALQQRAAAGEIPARGREILDAELRVALARSLAERRPQDAARASVEHAESVLSLVEGEYRAGRATEAERDRARQLVRESIRAAGPAAADRPSP